MATSNIDSYTTGFFKIKSLGLFIRNLFQVVLILGTVATFFYLIWGSIEYITSGGNQDRTKAARDKITQAVIGLTLLASLWAIWRIIIFFLGLSPTTEGPFEINFPRLY